MQLTWGRVGGKPLYAEYQINIGNINNRVTWPMNYVLLTTNSYEMFLNTSQYWHHIWYRTTEHHSISCSPDISFFSTEIIIYTPKSYQTHHSQAGYGVFFFAWPVLYLRNCSAVCNIRLNKAAISRGELTRKQMLTQIKPWRNSLDLNRQSPN